MASHADVLKETIAHASIESSMVEKAATAAQFAKNKSIELELITVIISMGKYAGFHPTKEVEGEKLLTRFVRNCLGFLINRNIYKIKVHQTIVKRHSIHLQKHAIMAHFVRGKQSSHVIAQWVSTLQAKLGAWIGLSKDLGCGFFQIYTKVLVVAQRLLMLTPYRSK